MTRTTSMLSVFVVLGAGCAGSAASPQSQPVVEPAAEPDVQRDELRHDLEATVLEAYSQLTLGNLEAYRDGIAEDRPVTLIGVVPDDVVFGLSPAGVRRDRRLYRELGPHILSKNLDVHLSRDGAVGWVYDEVSYRVPYMGRTASIPIRWTGIYVRDLDRWVQVLEHQSYAVPIGDIEEMAASGALEAPAKMKTYYHRLEGASPLLLDILGRVHNAPAKYRQQKLAGDPDALLLLPDPDGEFRGREVPRAPSLASLFGEGATVGLRDYRIFIAPEKSVGWAAANLVVKTSVHDEPVEIGLRATYLLENRPTWGWQVVQAHVSAPLTRAQLSARVFGPSDIESVTPGE